MLLMLKCLFYCAPFLFRGQMRWKLIQIPIMLQKRIIQNYTLINLQLGKFESLLEALYSIHPEMKITGDALFRKF